MAALSATGGMNPYHAKLMSGQEQVQPNPHMQAPTAPGMDPKKAYWQGFMSDLASNLNQDYRPFNSGAQMQSQAQQINYKNKLQQNEIMYRRTAEQNAIKRSKLEKDTVLRDATNAWVKHFKDTKGKPVLTRAEFMTLSPGDRSKFMMQNAGRGTQFNPSASMQDMEYLNERQDIVEDPDSTPEEIERAQLEQTNLFRAKRGQGTTTQDDVTFSKDPRTGEWKTLTGESFEDVQKRSNLNAADRAAGITTAQKTAGYNVDMDKKLLTLIDSTEKQLTDMNVLLERVKAGPATGRVEEIGVAWDAQKQAMEAAFLTAGWNKVIDMKDQGMTFGNFTEKEFERINKTMGVMGNTREANVIQLERQIEDMTRWYNTLHDRHDNPVGFMTRRRKRKTNFSSKGKSKKVLSPGEQRAKDEYDKIMNPGAT